MTGDKSTSPHSGKEEKKSHAMAAVSSSSGGFSYAQAARGRSSASASQTSSNKLIASDAATPAAGLLSESSTGGAWADEVESSMGTKAESSKVTQEEHRGSTSKESIVERVKEEDRVQHGMSGLSSPDLAASSTASTTNQDDSLSGKNGSSSETTWETKSQASEPAWIADRKERQSNSQASETTLKGELRSKDESAPEEVVKAIKLQDAPPPVVNPWQRRAEEAKARIVAPPKPTSTTNTSPDTPALKENGRPQADSRRKVGPASQGQAETSARVGDDTKRPNGVQAKRAHDGRANGRTPSKNLPDGPRTDFGTGAPIERSSGGRISPPSKFAIPPVKDETSWPTPETVQEKDRNLTVERDVEEKREEDTAPGIKRKKQEWKPMPVVPNVIWQTQSMNEPKDRKSRPSATGERGGRGGSSARGRGGLRGGANGIVNGERTERRASPPSRRQASESVNAARRRSEVLERESNSSPADSGPLNGTNARPGHKADPISDTNPKRQATSETLTRTLTGQKPTAESTTKTSPERQRSKSPVVSGLNHSDIKEDDLMPEPIPQQSSVTTPAGTTLGSVDINTREGPPIRMVPTESRKESRGFENARDQNWNPPRGGKRGGRGRGGNAARELANGQVGGHTFGNNYHAEYSGVGTFGMPPSPSAFQSSRGNHQYTYAQPTRGGWTRANPRSQSIPVDSFYPRFAPPFGPLQTAQPQLHAYGPAMFDYNGYPISALPYAPHMDAQYLLEMVSTQLDYYYSIDNLLKDTFLRAHMDSQGFVLLDFVASFKRLKNLTSDRDLLKAACIGSEVIEICVGEDGKERLRRREGWDQWVLPMDQRDPSARTEGPPRLEPLERQYAALASPAASQYHSPASVGLPPLHHRFDRRSHDAGYSLANGYQSAYGPFGGSPEQADGDATNGEERRGRAARSPIRDDAVTTPLHDGAEDADLQPDAFPDEQASQLTVVVKVDPGQQRVPYHNAASRTFSNGSIDSRSVMTDLEGSMDAQVSKPANERANIDEPDKTVDEARHTNPSAARSADRPSAPGNVHVYWVKEEDGSVDNLPHGLAPEPYVQLRLKALDQREQAATGNCPYDLDVLYQFWSHFLIRNFNNQMYSEFRFLANDDATVRRTVTGLQNLVKFYSQSLSSHSPIRDRVVKDYVYLVKNEPAELESVAFKSLRSAWRNGALNLKNRKKLADLVDEPLKEQLDKIDA